MIARDVATALLDLDLHIQFAALRQVGDHMIRVHDLHVVGCLDIACSYDAIAVFSKAERDFVTVMQLEHNAFEIQQDVDHIFLNTINRGILVEHACDRHFCRCITHHGREQNAPNGIAQRVPISALERLQCDFGPVVA